MAGKPTKDTVLLNVDVNTDPARKGLNDLNNTTRDLEKTNKDLRVEMQRLEAQGKKDTQEYRNLQTQIKANDATIKANKTRMSEMRKEIGLNNLTMRELRSEAKKLRNQLENTVPNTPEWNDLNNQLGDVNNRMGELRKMGGKTDGVFGKLKGAVGGLLPAFGFAAIIAGVGKIIGKLYEMFEIITKNRTALHQMTGATGSELSQLTADVMATANTFNKTFEEISLMANNLAGSMHIPFNEALKLVNEGLLAGADSTGEMTDIVKEYGTQMEAAGLDAEQFMAIISQQPKSGIYTDKGIDTIKEGMLRLREMTSSTRDALAGIGIDADKMQADLSSGNITLFQAMQQVATKLDEFPEESAIVGTAIADIFGGAGEDAGIAYLKTLDEITLSMDDVVDKTDESYLAQQKLLQANQELESAYANLFGETTAGFTGVKASFKSFLADFVKNLGSGDKLFNFFEKILNAIENTGAANKYIENLLGPFKQLGGLVGDIADLFGLAGDKTKTFEGIIKILMTTTQIAMLPINLLISGLRSIVQLLSGDFESAVKTAAEPLVNLAKTVGIVDEDFEMFSDGTQASLGDVQDAVSRFSNGAIEAYDDVERRQQENIKAAQSWVESFTDITDEGKEQLYDLRLAYLAEKQAFIQSLVDKTVAQGIFNGKISDMQKELQNFYNSSTADFEKQSAEIAKENAIKTPDYTPPGGTDKDKKKASYLTEADDSGEQYAASYDAAYKRYTAETEAKKQAENEWQAWLKQESARSEAEIKAEFDRQLADDETRKQVRQQLQLVTDQQVYDQSLMQLNWFLNQKYISEEEHAKLVSKLNADLLTKRMEGWRQYLEMAGALAGSFSNLVQSLQEKDLAAAGDNEEKQKKVRKKYADASFVAMLAEMVAKQAMGVVDIWSKWGEFPPVAIGLTAGLLAATLPQIAIANSERQRVKQLAKGNLWQVLGREDGKLYNAEYHRTINTGLYNRPGLALFNEDPSNPELIVDGKTTRKLRMQYPGVVRTIQYVSQHAAGYYDAVAGTLPANENNNNNQQIALMAKTIEVMQAVENKLDNLYAKITYEQIADVFDKVDFLEQEAS